MRPESLAGADGAVWEKKHRQDSAAATQHAAAAVCVVYLTPPTAIRDDLSWWGFSAKVNQRPQTLSPSDQTRLYFEGSVAKYSQHNVRQNVIGLFHGHER